MADAVRDAQGRKVVIDHHLNPEPFCRVTISHPEISSTSELIFRLICRLGCFDDITLEGAECIYTGMMTDTGGFTYNSNNREIYFIISELLSKGIDKDDIYRKVFNTYSEGRLRLMGYVLYEKMQVYPQVPCSFNLSFKGRTGQIPLCKRRYGRLCKHSSSDEGNLFFGILA